jgi:hypothetical protein
LSGFPTELSIKKLRIYLKVFVANNNVSLICCALQKTTAGAHFYGLRTFSVRGPKLDACSASVRQFKVMKALTRELIRVIRNQFALSWRGLHGAPHWARVRQNGLRLAALTGANM